ncbi:hypothetical protein NV63_13285 [Elizabethkingia anophelis]|nr:hypothetical protein NV63_13285 [Elizabethkingia anophelis]
MLIISFLLFQSSENLGFFFSARCVFVRTNFSSFSYKDSLAFFAKRGKNFGTQFFLFWENQV